MQIALPRPATGARIAAAAPPRTTVAVAAALSLGAAWVHLAYVAPHLRQWWAYGAFFLATGIGQALFAPLILRWPRPWLAVVGIAGNLAIVAMYVLSRTNGAPLGPHANVPERVGTVDLATAGAEVVLIGASGDHPRNPGRAGRSPMSSQRRARSSGRYGSPGTFPDPAAAPLPTATRPEGDSSGGRPLGAADRAARHDEPRHPIAGWSRRPQRRRRAGVPGSRGRAGRQ